MVNNYTIYKIDIHPKGFKVIEFDDYITDETVELTLGVLENKDLEREMCEQNYVLARRFFSYTVLGNKLRMLLNNAYGTDQI